MALQVAENARIAATASLAVKQRTLRGTDFPVCGTDREVSEVADISKRLGGFSVGRGHQVLKGFQQCLFFFGSTRW